MRCFRPRFGYFSSVELERGWGLKDRQLCQLRLLEHVADNMQGGGVPGLPEWAPPGTDAGQDAIADLKLFEAHGLLENFAVGGGGTAHARLSGIGIAYVDELRGLRDDGPAQRDAAPNAMLAWLDDWEAAHEGLANIDDFVTTRFGTWFGAPFSPQLVQRANDRLYEDGLIDGPRAEEAGVGRPRLTPAGERLLRSGRSFQQGSALGGDTYNVNQHGAGSFAQAGPGGVINAQVTNIGSDQRRQILALAEALERTIATTDQPVPPDVANAPGELRAGEQSNDIGRVKRAVRTLQTAALGGFGAALGTDAYHPMHQLAQTLGLLG